MRYSRKTHVAMRVSWQPRYITHYRSSVGLISTPPSPPWQTDGPIPSKHPYRFIATRSAALQPHALSGAMSLPDGNCSTLRPRRRRTRHRRDGSLRDDALSHLFHWNDTSSFISREPRIPNAPYTIDACALSQRLSASVLLLLLHEIRMSDLSRRLSFRSRISGSSESPKNFIWISSNGNSIFHTKGTVFCMYCRLFENSYDVYLSRKNANDIPYLVRLNNCEREP